MDNFGIPTEINVGVMKAIAELQYTESDYGFVNEKKINDHVEYYEHDKDSLVRQSLDNLTFLGILVRTGSSAFALRQNLQFPNGASAIPWITPQKQDGNLKRAAKMKRNSTAKKKRYSPAEIDSLFSRYFEEYRNMKTIDNPVNSEVKTGPEDTTNMLPFNALIEDQKSKPMEEVSKNVDLKLKSTNRKSKQNFEAKKKRYSPAEIDSLFSRYFEEYRNMKTIDNPVNSEEKTGPEDTTSMFPFNALIEDQKSKPMEEVLENVEPKLKNTNRKNKRNFEAKKKRYSPAEIDSLFSRYFEEYKNMKTITNREHFEVNNKPTVLEDTNNNLPLNIVLKDQISKPMEKVSKNVDSKLKNTKQKNKRSFNAKKKRYSPAKIDFLFAYYFKKYKHIKTINNPENSEARNPSKLGMTGLADDNNILQHSKALNGQTSNSIQIAVEKVELKRTIAIAKEKRNLKTKKKYSCPEIDSLFANCFEKYKRNVTIDNPDVAVLKRDSILGSIELKVASNILPINAFKDQESFRCWKFTDPLVI